MAMNLLFPGSNIHPFPVPSAVVVTVLPPRNTLPVLVDSAEISTPLMRGVAVPPVIDPAKAVILYWPAIKAAGIGPET